MIGNSLARIYKASGYKVERINHLGDWGTAFGKLIVMYLRENRPTDDATLESLTVKELNILYASFSKAAEAEPSRRRSAKGLCGTRTGKCPVSQAVACVPGRDAQGTDANLQDDGRRFRPLHRRIVLRRQNARSSKSSNRKNSSNAAKNATW